MNEHGGFQKESPFRGLIFRFHVKLHGCMGKKRHQHFTGTTVTTQNLSTVIQMRSNNVNARCKEKVVTLSEVS